MVLLLRNMTQHDMTHDSVKEFPRMLQEWIFHCAIVVVIIIVFFRLVSTIRLKFNRWPAVKLRQSLVFIKLA